MSKPIYDDEFEIIKRSIVAQVKAIRKDMHIRQDVLSKKSNVDIKTIIRLENKAEARFESFLRIVNGLGYTIKLVKKD